MKQILMKLSILSTSLVLFSCGGGGGSSNPPPQQPPVLVCDAGYHIVNNSCEADTITFSTQYTEYGSCSASNACDGTGTKSRTYSCMKYVNDILSGFGSLSDCVGTQLTASCDSPAGTKNKTITNGSQQVSCPQGSSVETVLTTSCDSGFHAVANACVADVITYTSIYSSYGACSVTQVCGGQGTQSRTLSQCEKFTNGVSSGFVDLSNCTAQDLTISCDSPAGQKINTILHGTETVSCLAGSSVETFVSRSCTDTDYYDSGTDCQTFTVSNIQASTDGKQLTVDGTNLNFITTAKIYEIDGTTLIDTMIIFLQTNTQLILKPSQNINLSNDVILRLH